jgi:hypothetical protein
MIINNTFVENAFEIKLNATLASFWGCVPSKEVPFSAIQCWNVYKGHFISTPEMIWGH